MTVTNEQILAAVEKLGDKIDTVNGRVRENEQAIAALTEWKAGQTKAHEDLEGEVGGLRNRQNLFGGLLATLQAIAAAVVIWFRD